MDNDNDIRYKVDKKVQDFNIEHASEIATISEYAFQKLKFDGKITLAEGAMQQQAVETHPITVEKSLVKDIMIDLIIIYSLRASVKASELNLTELELSLDKPKSFFEKTDDDTCEIRCKSFKDIMKNNSTILTNLNSGNITDMETAITNFSNIKNRPRETSDSKKSEGTEKITKFLDQADVFRKNMGKLIHSYLPHNAAQWDAINKLGEAEGIHHVSLVLLYTDLVTEVPLRNVKATITDGETIIIKKSTQIGRIQVKGMENGNWTVTSEHATYTTDVQNNIGIEKGKIKEVKIKLTKLGA